MGVSSAWNGRYYRSTSRRRCSRSGLRVGPCSSLCPARTKDHCSADIESALLKIDDLATTQEGLAAEEALVLRGWAPRAIHVPTEPLPRVHRPNASSLKTYTDALERLNANIAFKSSSDRDTASTARLVETGAKKLTQLYTKLVAEASSGSPAQGTEFALSSLQFPPNLLGQLKPLVAFIRTLPLPATHPSHPAAPAILSVLKEAQRGYADMRGNWSRKCLEVHGRRAVERAESVEGVQAGREFGRWVGNLLLVAEVRTPCDPS
jgi:exocyst complex component 7